MAAYTPHEKKIWQKGFFQGLHTAKEKYDIIRIEPKLEETKEYIVSFITEKTCEIFKLLEKSKRRKIRLRGASIKRYNEDIIRYNTLLQFFFFCQSVGLDAFINFLKESTFFEEVLYKNGKDYICEST